MLFDWLLVHQPCHLEAALVLHDPLVGSVPLRVQRVVLLIPTLFLLRVAVWDPSKRGCTTIPP